MFIISLSAYIRGTLFSGIITATIAAGFASKFYGEIDVKMTIEALKIEIGMEVEYLTLKIMWLCFKIPMGCFSVRICIPIITLAWSNPVNIFPPLVIKGV